MVSLWFMPYKLHLPQNQDLLPIAPLGENLVPENLRFFLQGDLEREAIWPRYGKDRTADGCTGALSNGDPQNRRGQEKRDQHSGIWYLGAP